MGHEVEQIRQIKGVFVRCPQGLAVYFLLRYSVEPNVYVMHCVYLYGMKYVKYGQGVRRVQSPGYKHVYLEVCLF